MSVDFLKKPILTVLVSVVTLFAALVVAPPPQAQAAERNLVAFGDSVLADPALGIYLRDRLSGAFGQRPLGVDCPKGNNYAARTGAKLGLPVRDFSCSGAVSMSRGPQISAQIDTAIARGALNPETSRVIFSSGFNDTYNNTNLNLAQIREKYVRFTRPQIERIRQAAPNARIQIVGYPTIGDGLHYCLVHAGSSWGRIPLPQIADFENKSQWMQVDLARATGTEFIDMKPLTRDAGTCGGDGSRKWAGLVDFNAGGGNLPLHINARGHEHVANVLAGS